MIDSRIRSFITLGIIAGFAASVHAQQPEAIMPEVVRDAAEIQAQADNFTFVRIVYEDAAPGGITGAWSTDYPEAELRFSQQIRERLGLSVRDSVNLELTDPALSDYPFIYIVEGGRLRFTEEEVPALRAYLLNGGFLMVDDFWRANEWASLATQLNRVFPDRPIVELPPDHEVFSSYYRISEPRGVPGAVEYRTGISEEPHYRGILADDGRLMVLLLYNQDFGDAWEHIADPEYPVELSLGTAVAMGINIVAYALTH